MWIGGDSDPLSCSVLHMCLFSVSCWNRWQTQAYGHTSVAWITVGLVHSLRVCEDNIPPKDKVSTDIPTFPFVSLSPRLPLLRPGLPGWVLWRSNRPVYVSHRVSGAFMRAVWARLLQLPALPMWVPAKSNRAKQNTEIPLSVAKPWTSQSLSTLFNLFSSVLNQYKVNYVF